MEIKYLDLLPDYIPLQIQILDAGGEAADPGAISLTIYEEDGADNAYGNTQIDGSPFTPVKIASRDGYYGTLVAKSALTAGNVYLCLWDVTIDGVETAKQEAFLAANAGAILDAAIPAEPTEGSINEAIAALDELVSDGAIAARITGIEDIDFSDTMLASLETAGINALNTASPATITATSAFDRLDDIEGKVDEIQGSGFEEANDNMHVLRERFDDTFGNLGVENIPSVDAIVTEMERAGGMIDAIKTTVDVNLDARVSTRNTLGTGTQEVTYTLLVAGTTDSIAGALVEARIENNSQAAVVVSGYTNFQGKITFMLDPGTYYLWRSKANYVFTNPETLIVENGDE